MHYHWYGIYIWLSLHSVLYFNCYLSWGRTFMSASNAVNADGIALHLYPVRLFVCSLVNLFVRSIVQMLPITHSSQWHILFVRLNIKLYYSSLCRSYVPVLYMYAYKIKYVCALHCNHGLLICWPLSSQHFNSKIDLIRSYVCRTSEWSQLY